MINVQYALHIFVSVLIVGTLWRLISYHLIASPNTQLQHLGTGMSIQY